jgi:hypothetical protein
MSTNKDDRRGELVCPFHLQDFTQRFTNDL